MRDLSRKKLSKSPEMTLQQRRHHVARADAHKAALGMVYTSPNMHTQAHGTFSKVDSSPNAQIQSSAQAASEVRHHAAACALLLQHVYFQNAQIDVFADQCPPHCMPEGPHPALPNPVERMCVGCFSQVFPNIGFE